MSASFLTAEWRDLVMLNYEVDPALLEGLVPAGTELDLWDGRLLVSMVGFRFLRTRVLGLAIRGYARQRDGGTVEYRVEHPQWEVSAAAESTFECDVAALYGAPFAGLLGGRPASAFVAGGSAVTVRRGVRLA